MDPTAPLTGSVAIVGMAGRFPGAPNIQTLWENLVDTIDSVREVPAQRWPMGDFYHAKPATALKSYCQRGGFLDDVELFDNDYFGISKDEASLMDPKQRLLLETVEEALYDAGYGKDDLKNSSTGVFIGSAFDYHARRLRMPKRTSPQGILGNHNPVLANRLSHHFDLMGPSLYVNTFCSSSLIAVHLACQSILRNECSMAMAGGVHVLDLDHYISLSQIQALSVKGCCSTFDQSADGFVPGEGVGVVLLKVTRQALEDNDNIYAIIRGSAINHTGKANNLASPRREAQERLLAAAYASAGFRCDTVSAIETHGTGTILGDMIEFKALNNFFSRHSSRRHFCALGSIKANIGHLEPASGIAGLIKTALCLRHRRLPGLVHFSKLNRFIRIEDSPFYIPSQTKDWQANGHPRRAGVSAFGLSGSSAHVILEEAPANDKNQQPPAWRPGPAFTHRRFPLLNENSISYEQHLGLTCAPVKSFPGALPTREDSTVTVHDAVMDMLSRKIRIDSPILDETAPLDTLGIDSILHVEVIQALIEKWPAATQVQDELVAAHSIGKIIAILNECIQTSLKSHGGARPPATAGCEEIAARLTGLKQRPENRVCAACPDLKEPPGKLTTRLRVDERHIFFFDHPLDHVSGIHLIEAMLQTVGADYRRSHHEKSDHEILFPEINVEFIRMCHKSDRVRIEAAALPFKDLDEATELYSVTIQSERHVHCRGSIKVGQFDARATPLAANALVFGRPCSSEAVNKRNPDNVLISDVAPDISPFAFHVRPLVNHPYFSDPEGSFTPTIYLLEAFRQTQRYLDNHCGNLEKQENDSLLMQLGIRMFMPVERIATVRLHTRREIVRPEGPGQKHAFIKGWGSIHTGQREVGECRIHIIQYQS